MQTTSNLMEETPRRGELKRYEWLDHTPGDWRRLLRLPEPAVMRQPIKAVLSLVEHNGNYRYLLRLGRVAKFNDIYEQNSVLFVPKLQNIISREKALQDMQDMKERIRLKGVTALNFPGGWRPFYNLSD